MVSKPIRSLQHIVMRTLTGALLLASASTLALEPGQLYRYVDDQGVKVMSSSLPPEYAQKGYEVINHHGRVVKTVEPAVDPDVAEKEAERKARERKLLAEFEVLDRRYSNEQEIYAARDRKLEHLDANIAILNSNINSLEDQIDNLTSKAADYERRGRKVPATILQRLEETRAELQSTEEMLESRKAEYDQIHEQYEHHAKLYRNGKALAAKKILDAQQQANKANSAPQ